MTRFIPILLLAVICPPIAAQTRPEVLPETCESALALSAAPEHLRQEAALYLLGRDGYAKTRAGSNGFTCLVNRDDSRSIKPTCYDAEGTRSIVPKILEFGRLLMAGTPVSAIRSNIASAFQSGKLESPARPGVAYMLSEYNRPWNPNANRLGWFPPHIMFYAPHLTQKDVGFSPSTWNSHIQLPFVAYEGPQGFMIVRTERVSRPHLAPLPDGCPAWVAGRSSQLPVEARQFDFWIGEWDVNLRIRQADGSWPNKVSAAVKIYPVLDRKAILELWDSPTIKGFSLRYFDAEKKKWVLWLNWPGRNRSAGSSLEGEFRHGRGDFFSSSKNPDGTETISRYSFNDITPKSLRWDDAYSKDGGKTWSHNWIMEFSRTGQAPSLAPGGGKGHTYGSGGRCDKPGFRSFEPLAGRRKGTLQRRRADGGWTKVDAELVGYKVLAGCAVISFLRAEFEAGSPFESFHYQTWNTSASRFEEDYLDILPETPLEVYYGDAENQTLALTLSDKIGPAKEAKKRVWSIGDSKIALEVSVSRDSGRTWQVVEKAEFPR